MGVDVKVSEKLDRDPGDEGQVVHPLHLSLAFPIAVADLSFCWYQIRFSCPENVIKYHYCHKKNVANL